ncbi:iron-sulfur cluster assembly scaffold protein [Candidatus Pyrohabitans sp.]
MYSKILIDHFRNPRNMGRMENPDGVGKVGNPACGDVMYIYIKVGKNDRGEEIIEDIKFETFGCAAAIGTSSMVTELAKGKTLEEAEKISKDDVAEAVGGLPPIKMHCSLLASDGLKAAIADYRKKKAGKGDAAEG